jgi:alpha-glucosidase
MSLAQESLPLVGTSLAEPHHDGSDQYVLERPEALGGEAVVRLRVPRGTPVDTVVLRYVRDGEPRAVRAVVDEETATDTWWRAAFPAHNPATRYRWLLVEGEAWTWVNGLGPAAHDVPDSDDFVLALGGGPDWHLGSVAYQVFPDRFASSGLPVEPPEWAIRRGWDELPTGRGPATPREWFGGDLTGLEARLDHVERLGASLLYLTPFFPAGSTHRYDGTTFDRVDPLLGGDEALASLVGAAHARGIRVVGDLTLNHCGRDHEWMAAALADGAVPERDFFYFDESLPAGYESWLGFPQLPKLDWRSPELRRRMDEVLQKWLAPPFCLDGWRIDVANMIGRYRDLDLNAEVARGVRRAIADARADALLVAEHGHDFRADLAGDGWHGAMNYSGFLRPVWTWLRADEPAPEQRHSFWGLPVGVPRAEGASAVAAMRAFRAGVPWQSVLHSWTLLDSHDTARFRTVAGSRERQQVGVGLQMTSPGVPMVFAGDELGLEGEWGEDARRTMPWSRPETWDGALVEAYRSLIALRRSSDALARGGIRYASVGSDAIAYLRETASERLLCLAARAEHEPIRVPLAALGCTELEPVYGAEATARDGTAVLPSEGPSFNVWRLIDG